MCDPSHSEARNKSSYTWDVTGSQLPSSINVYGSFRLTASFDGPGVAVGSTRRRFYLNYHDRHWDREDKRWPGLG
jgi:hypothetical protein